MEHFEEMAANYDTDKRVRRAGQIAAKLREYIGDGEGKLGLEYGAGTGLVGLALADMFAGMLLVDSSPAMIGQIEGKLRQTPLPQVTVMERDFLVDPLPDMQVDYLFTSLVLHHIIEIEEILSRFYELLLPGGKLLIVDLSQNDGSFHAKCADYQGYDGFDTGELSIILGKVGFRVLRSEVFLEDTKLIDGREHPYSMFILEAQK